MRLNCDRLIDATTLNLQLTGLYLIILSSKYSAIPVGLESNCLGGGFQQSKPDGSFPSSGAWSPAWLMAAGAACTTTAVRSGGNGLWIYTGEETSAWWSGPYQTCSTVPGEVFTGKAWCRSLSTWTFDSRALVQVTFLSAASATLATYESPAITQANQEWQELTVTTQPAPLYTAYVRLRLYIEKPNGTLGQSIANFDDVSLVLIGNGGTVEAGSLMEHCSVTRCLWR